MKFAFGSTAEKNGFPRIDRIAPAAAIPGGEIVIHGSGFASRTGARPVVHFGEAEASFALPLRSSEVQPGEGDDFGSSLWSLARTGGIGGGREGKGGADGHQGDCAE